MKTFEEFVTELEPTFFEGGDEKCEDKGKKLPPWMKKDGDKAEKGEKKDGDKAEKKNPFMPKGKKKE